MEKKVQMCEEEKKDVILNKILICSDTEHSKVERNKIISIIIMESQLDKKKIFFFFFLNIWIDSLGKPV